MIRTTLLSLAILTAMTLATGTAMAQVSIRAPFVGVDTGNQGTYVRAPFVRVETGRPGVYVRAPFVNLWIPNGPSQSYLVPPPPNPPMAPPAPTVRPMPRAAEIQLPPVQNLPPPQLILPEENAKDWLRAPAVTAPPQQALTLAEFAKTFQPKAGPHDVTIINPINNQPAAVHFILPEGPPRRVIVDPDGIEFRYGLRQFVRIKFRAAGATIVTR